MRACLLGSFWLLPACTQWHYELGAPLSQAAMPAATGAVMLQQVLENLGPPQYLSATSNGFVMVWDHWRIKEETLGVRLGALGADIMSVDWGNASVRAEFLLLTFDLQHRLIGSAHSQWESKLGGGQAIQPFFGFVSLVDVDDLLEMMPQHRWGSGALQPIPRALNRDSNSTTGQNGLEQRGTPSVIGQQSLEMK